MTEIDGVRSLATDEDPARGAALCEDPRPLSALAAGDLHPGDLVRRLDIRRAGIVTRVDASADKVWIRQVSPKDRSYVLEERLFRAEWLDLLIDAEPWTSAHIPGEVVLFVDYAGHARIGRVIDHDGIFLRLAYTTSAGVSRKLWVDRYIPQQLGVGRSASSGS